MDFRDHARSQRRIIVSGPLALFADGLRRELAGQGYALDTVGDHVRLLADLSGWLSGQDFTAAVLTHGPVHVDSRSVRKARGLGEIHPQRLG